MSELSCPTCGTELSPAVLFAHADAQAAFARLAAVSIPLGARVMGYLTLFTPPKTRLTIAKQCKLLLGLLPDLERQAITAKGRDWPVPLQLWSAAFDQLQARRAAGSLDLPLSGHGYLYAVLVGMADRAEASDEAATELQRRHRVDPAMAQPAQAAPVLSRAPAPFPVPSNTHKPTPMPKELQDRWVKKRPTTEGENP